MKTRRLLGWVAMATMVLSTSCSSDEVVNDYSPKNAIQFGTYVGRDAEARATVIDNQNLGTEGFGVFAYYTGETNFDNSNIHPNFMYNQAVKKDSEKGWIYEPVKYWPNNDKSNKVSFFAYAPWDANTTDNNNTNLNLIENTTTGTPTVTYLVDTDVTKQIDLLYAEPVKDASKKNINDKVIFNFKHALSRIGFKVQALVDWVNNQQTQATPDQNNNGNNNIASGTSITVNSIKITFGCSYRDNGTLNLGTGTWTNGNTNNNQSCSYTLDSDNFETITMTTEPQKLNKNDSYLMILPCTFDALQDDGTTADASDKMNIEVTYTVVTTDSNLAGGNSTIVNTVNSGDFTWTFAQGKAYNFVLHLGMTSVKIDANVAEWDTTEGSDVVVNVPINSGTNPTQP